MHRSLVALLAVGPLVAAPAAKEKEAAVLYFPVAEGAKRVMEASAGKAGFATKAFETIETVSKVEKATDGKYRVTVERESKGTTFGAVYEVSADGLSRVGTPGPGLVEPVVLLKLPAKPGDTWKSGGGTATLGKEETVEVPAGKYKAVPVIVEQDRGGQPVKTTAWYAPGVGMVKSVTTANGFDTTYVLKSFTPGK